MFWFISPFLLSLFLFCFVWFSLILFQTGRCHMCHCCVYALYFTNAKGTLCTENTSHLRCHFINYRSRRQKVIRERSTFTATDGQTVFITHVSLLWFLWYTAPRWYWHSSWGHASPVPWSAVTPRVRETKDCMPPWLIRPRGEHCTTDVMPDQQFHCQLETFEA